MSAYASFTPAQLKAMHVTEHRRVFPNSNPVQIEGCCCAVACELRSRTSTHHPPEIPPHTPSVATVEAKRQRISKVRAITLREARELKMAVAKW